MSCRNPWTHHLYDACCNITDQEELQDAFSATLNGAEAKAVRDFILGTTTEEFIKIKNQHDKIEEIARVVQNLGY